MDTDECIEFVGFIDKDGYGRIYCRVTKTNTAAHRAAWVAVNGPIPKGTFVLHSCHNRRCINIKHLRAGDNAENMRDRAASGRNRSGRDRLTPELIKKIRVMCGSGMKQRAVAEALNVSKSSVGDVMTGRCWSDVG